MVVVISCACLVAKTTEAAWLNRYTQLLQILSKITLQQIENSSRLLRQLFYPHTKTIWVLLTLNQQLTVCPASHRLHWWDTCSTVRAIVIVLQKNLEIISSPITRCLQHLKDKPKKSAIDKFSCNLWFRMTNSTGLRTYAKKLEEWLNNHIRKLHAIVKSNNIWWTPVQAHWCKHRKRQNSIMLVKREKPPSARWTQQCTPEHNDTCRYYFIQGPKCRSQPRSMVHLGDQDKLTVRAPLCDQMLWKWCTPPQAHCTR